MHGNRSEDEHEEENENDHNPMLTLAYPWLLALVALPLLVRLLPAYRQRKTGVVVPFMARLSKLLGREPEAGAVVVRAPVTQHLTLWLSWLLIVAALARPQWLEPPVTRTVPTRDLLLAVDLSGSMDTEDFTDAAGKRVNRLVAVKEVLADFLAKRKGDRVGLIFFGTAAFVQTTFTEDLDALQALLDEAQVRMAGPQTAFGDAIGLALTVFERDTAVQDRVLIALTDGNDTGSRVPPVRAAEIAHDRHIVIHTIAVGDPKAAGEEKLDEATLKKVAATTGGRYSRANDRESLAKIYAELDALRARQAETISHRPRLDLFQWPLGVALVLSMLYQAIRVLKHAATRTAKSASLPPAGKGAHA